MSSDKSNESPTASQRKANWRATDLAEEVWNALGFNIQMDESMIRSWVNPFRKLVDKDYVRHLTYVAPQSDMFWDIPLSPNAWFYQVFNEFDQRIPDLRWLPMEFERLNQFHNKYGKKIKDIWSNDAPKVVKNYKPWSFKNATFYQ